MEPAKPKIIRRRPRDGRAREQLSVTVASDIVETLREIAFRESVSVGHIVERVLRVGLEAA